MRARVLIAAWALWLLAVPASSGAQGQLSPPPPRQPPHHIVPLQVTVLPSSGAQGQLSPPPPRQPPHPTPPPTAALYLISVEPLQPVDPERLYHSGRRLRSVGLALTIVGAVLATAGVALIAAGIGYKETCGPHWTCSLSPFSDLMGSGVPILGLSVGALAGGPSLLTLGNHRIRWAREMGYRAWLLPQLQVDPGAGRGAGMLLSFRF
ncbi:MAG: hypothetical protein RMK29_12170 [Myxococcales bacterium]|nr:hypothetical protein [Myxococcota bacterium]MDW8282460.1 hypothetical protein [Myxococcales bacterium]